MVISIGADAITGARAALRLVEIAFRKDCGVGNSEALVAAREEDWKAHPATASGWASTCFSITGTTFAHLSAASGRKPGSRRISGADFHLQRQILRSRCAGRDEGVVLDRRADA